MGGVGAGTPLHPCGLGRERLCRPEGGAINVETSVTVTKAVIDDEGLRRRLIEEARNRLIELGLATADQLRGEPVIIASPQPFVGDEAMRWVNVTFGWANDGIGG